MAAGAAQPALPPRLWLGLRTFGLGYLAVQGYWVVFRDLPRPMSDVQAVGLLGGLVVVPVVLGTIYLAKVRSWAGRAVDGLSGVVGGAVGFAVPIVFVWPFSGPCLVFWMVVGWAGMGLLVARPHWPRWAVGLTVACSAAAGVAVLFAVVPRLAERGFPFERYGLMHIFVCSMLLFTAVACQEAARAYERRRGGGAGG